MKTLILGSTTFDEIAYQDVLKDDFKIVVDILELKNIANEIEENSPEFIVFDFPSYDANIIGIISSIKRSYENITLIIIGNKKDEASFSKSKLEYIFLNRDKTISAEDVEACINPEEEWKTDWFAVSADTQKHWKLYLFFAILAIALMAYITYYPFNQY